MVGDIVCAITQSRGDLSGILCMLYSIFPMFNFAIYTFLRYCACYALVMVEGWNLPFVLALYKVVKQWILM